MTYKYHNDNTSKVMIAQGVPDWAAKMQIFRAAPAQRGSEAGASESDYKWEGLWSQSVVNSHTSQEFATLRAEVARLTDAVVILA